MSDIKSIIRNNFWGKYAISELHCLESKVMPKIISDRKAVQKYCKKIIEKKVNIDNPKTFTEKLNWYKLNVKDPLMVMCADKYAVREYVEKCGLGELLNTLYFVYNNSNEIELEKLPERFVLKGAHGSHMNIIVKDKNKVNWKHARLILNSWLRQDIYWPGREWAYKDMPRRIIAEKYLEDETGELRDYKFFCFNGKVEFMQLDAGRFKGKHYRNFYDKNLNLTNAGMRGISHGDAIKPCNMEYFEQMKEYAEILAKPFQFVRVDFYLIKGKIYFGELTFYHNGGNPDFYEESDDILYGEKWKLERK